jgi:hypothetical protein
MPKVSTQAAEPEFYEVPARMTAADVAGVIFALLSLAVIGAAGYIWLNPDLGWTEVRARFARQPARTTATAESGPGPGGAAVQAGTDATATGSAAAAGGATADRAATSCTYCGMFTDQTLGLVVASWSDGTTTHHDCWSCLVSYEKEQGLTLSSARVLDYASGLEQRRELDAAAAHYLYGVHKLEGSMKPYVAAFEDEASAKAAQPGLGGELLDFAGLRARLAQDVSGK